MAKVLGDYLMEENERLTADLAAARLQAQDREIELLRKLEALVITQRKLVKALEHYADQMCEHSHDYEGCGKLTDGECGGCRARAATKEIAR